MHWIDPTKTDAWDHLDELSKHPIDLTSYVPWAERIRDMQCSTPLFRLLFATERIDEDGIEALAALARETQAVEQFEMMLGGAEMNCTTGADNERCQVLHTASRDVFDDLRYSVDGRVCSSPSDAVKLATQRLDDLESFLGEIRGEFTDLVQIGIGGSDLGPRAIYAGLPEFRADGRRVHHISNVDPDDAAQVLDNLDLGTTLVVVITKSGTTLETLTNQELVVNRFAKLGLSEKQVFGKHFVAVTAEPEKLKFPYRRVFPMDGYIGGRYSATSMVGGVSLAFGLGIDNFREILRGAREMDLNALRRDPRENLSLLTALLGIWNRNFLKCHSVAVVPYSEILGRFVAHLQQLDMESNGKRVNRTGDAILYATGPIVWGQPGTNGQHSFFQHIHQSKTIVPCEFIGFRRCQTGFDGSYKGTTSQQKLLANLIAQAEAMATGQASPGNANKEFPGNRPSSVLIGDKLTPRTMGALLAYYENKVAFQGFVWNINSFDQEGVQLGKKLADKNLGFYDAESPDSTGYILMKAAGLV